MKNDIRPEITTLNIQVACLHFKTGDFSLLNIIGNRIMSDSTISNARDFAVIGFFVKQVALNYLNMKPRLPEIDFLEAKLVGEKYLASLLPISDDMDQSALWSNYHDFNIDLQKYSSSESAQTKEIYGQNPRITEATRLWLLEYLSNNREVLFYQNNNIFKGVISEYQRIGLTYSYTVKDTIIFSSIIALDRYYDYFRYQFLTPSGKVDEKQVQKIIFPYIDMIVQMASDDKISYPSVTDIMWELIKGWRGYYICFMDLPPKIETKPIELPEESKKKLSDTIGQALQKEIQL